MGVRDRAVGHFRSKTSLVVVKTHTLALVAWDSPVSTTWRLQPSPAGQSASLPQISRHTPEFFSQKSLRQSEFWVQIWPATDVPCPVASGRHIGAVSVNWNPHWFEAVWQMRPVGQSASTLQLGVPGCGTKKLVAICSPCKEHVKPDTQSESLTQASVQMLPLGI